MSMHLHVQTPVNCDPALRGLPHWPAARFFASCRAGDKLAASGF
jgi:hypothetical protein